MKIIYVNCRVKNYMKVDHRNDRCNLRSCEKKASKKQNKTKQNKNKGKEKSVSAAGVNTAVVIKP